MEKRHLSRTDECIDALIEDYGDMVYRLAFLYLKNKEDAEDVFQDVFMKLFTVTAQFESTAQLKSYVATTTVNRCKNILRSVWRKRVDCTDEIEELCNFADQSYTQREGELVKEVLALPLKYRRVLYLHYYEGYQTAEIAKMLTLPSATVRTQLVRGRELLKKYINESE
ncbi:MAG: sigma-70 family RNA polymerase sigma factor [Oscillospiraceae bacterium]|nr:sigma-70 family RNA polymerase sigma factor [Oscillospiraceae bacterium]